jgi:hypothetical protein
VDPAALLQLLGGGGKPGVSPAALVQKLIAERAEDDPTRQLLGSWLETRQIATSEPEPPARTARAPDDERWQALLAQIDAAGQALAQLQVELDVLRVRNLQLAQALGACPGCWGTDLTCATCAGEGAPGSATPDPARFRRYVRPALRRARPGK